LQYVDYDINKFIEFRPKRDGRSRPCIKGTRVEVQYIITDKELHNQDMREGLLELGEKRGDSLEGRMVL